MSSFCLISGIYISIEDSVQNILPQISNRGISWGINKDDSVYMQLCKSFCSPFSKVTNAKSSSLGQHIDLWLGIYALAWIKRKRIWLLREADNTGIQSTKVGFDCGKHSLWQTFMGVNGIFSPTFQKAFGNQAFVKLIFLVILIFTYFCTSWFWLGLKAEIPQKSDSHHIFSSLVSVRK